MCSKIGLQGLAVPRAEMQNCHISLRRIEILYLNYVVSGGKFASPHKDNLDPLDGSSPPPLSHSETSPGPLLGGPKFKLHNAISV